MTVVHEHRYGGLTDWDVNVGYRGCLDCGARQEQTIVRLMDGQVPGGPPGYICRHGARFPEHWCDDMGDHGIVRIDPDGDPDPRIDALLRWSNDAYREAEALKVERKEFGRRFRVIHTAALTLQCTCRHDHDGDVGLPCARCQIVTEATS